MSNHHRRNSTSSITSNPSSRLPGYLKLRRKFLTIDACNEYNDEGKYWKKCEIEGIFHGNVEQYPRYEPNEPWYTFINENLIGTIPENGIKILNWNVLFDLYHLEAMYDDSNDSNNVVKWKNPIKRHEAILQKIMEKNADIICLQEVTNVFLEFVLDCKFIQKEYRSSHVPGDFLIPYGQIILAKKSLPLFKIRLYRYEKNGDKQCVVSDFLFKNNKNTLESLSIANIHLQSGDATNDIMGLRRFNLHAAMRMVKCSNLITPNLESNHSAIVTGDFNFGEEGEENDAIYTWNIPNGDDQDWKQPTEFVDTFKDIHVPTMDCTKNTLAASLYPDDEGPKRIDRILLYSKQWKVKSKEIDSSSIQSKYPSDHYPCILQIKHSQYEQDNHSTI